MGRVPRSRINQKLGLSQVEQDFYLFFAKFLEYLLFDDLACSTLRNHQYAKNLAKHDLSQLALKPISPWQFQNPKQTWV